MSRTQVLLFPFNGNARETLSVLARMPEFEVLGFVDDNPSHRGVVFHGYPVLGGREILAERPDCRVLALPGSPANYLGRKAVIDGLGLPPGRFATVISPRACVGLGCTVGANCVIMDGVVLTSGVAVGDHVVILPNTVIAHDARIGDHTLIGSNVTVSGGVTIGRNVYLGSGSRVIHQCRLGDGALVGLGSNVIRPVAPGDTVVGNPARILRQACT